MTDLDLWDPTNPIWGPQPWPEWFPGFREHQKAAIAAVYDYFMRGANVVILNAPTGAGKTVIAEAVRRLLDVRSTVYVANTKGLQDQFKHDFPYAQVLKGRNNYPTLNFPEAFKDKRPMYHISAADCAIIGHGACQQCDDIAACPYHIARARALESRLCVTNTSYLLTEANGPGSFSRKDQFVVIDECDTLESVVMGNVETNISERMQKRLNLEPPKVKGADAKSNDWEEWCTGLALPAVRRERKLLEKQYGHMSEVSGAFIWNEDVPTRVVREHKAIDNLERRLRNLLSDLERDNAVYDGYNRGEVLFKPVKVDPYGPSEVWKHAQRWLLMSATVIDPQEIVESLGIDLAGLHWDVVNVPSTFDAANRPIFVAPVADMTFKNKDTAWPQMAEGVSRVLAKHPDERVLIHTVSYALAEYLKTHVVIGNGEKRVGFARKRTLLTYGDSFGREDVLNRFRKTPGAVLFAPSMDRGVDLPEDDCRVVIVCKVPYPNTADKQVNARMYSRGGQLWYSVQTVRSLVQMTGRGVRSASDTCTMYILDAQFKSNVWSKSRRLLPKWWVESLDWTGGGILHEAQEVS